MRNAVDFFLRLYHFVVVLFLADGLMFMTFELFWIFLTQNWLTLI